MQARTLKIIAALLIISAVFMGVIGYKISQEDTSKSRALTKTSPASEPSDFTYAQKLLIVNRSMAKGETITVEDVQLIPYPLLIEDSFSKAEDILNKKLESKIPVGAVIRQSHFDKQSKLSPHINSGYRALAIKVNETSSAGGFYNPVTALTLSSLPERRKIPTTKVCLAAYYRISVYLLLALTLSEMTKP